MEVGWAREAKREVLSISEKEDGCRGLETLRLAPAEREAAERSFSESRYVSISGYARNRALGWDHDPLVVARAAAAVTWLAGRAGRPIGQEDWKGLGKAMRDAFGTGHLPGADTIRQGLQVAEEHLLGAKKEKVAEDWALRNVCRISVSSQLLSWFARTKLHRSIREGSSAGMLQRVRRICLREKSDRAIRPAGRGTARRAGRTAAPES